MRSWIPTVLFARTWTTRLMDDSGRKGNTSNGMNYGDLDSTSHGLGLSYCSKPVARHRPSALETTAAQNGKFRQFDPRILRGESPHKLQLLRKNWLDFKALSTTTAFDYSCPSKVQHQHLIHNHYANHEPHCVVSFHSTFNVNINLKSY